ncbi:hybrid sensor histidine kinase/response regulator [Pseudoflavonifractor sp. 60]|uniref:hybrid sensor histidine kinase/response regulator n=1 Tax=Pseudoflavonifractor sp. 60 TaxID=2304576 RepID=UPI001368F834|nr:hybrid sensor histidine kinase/response regulator [Pseudoflavonifractor sp. 60]
MQHKKVRGSPRQWSSWRILVILALFVAIGAAGMLMSQQLLLDNARIMGKNLVTSYANDENSQMDEYDRILTMAMFYLEDMDRQGTDADQFEAWLVDYFNKSTTLIDTNSLDICAVLNGQVISASAIRDRDYDYASQFWYHRAMEAEGEVIFTDAYDSDVYNGRMVVTAAISAAGSDNAIAIDVPLEHFRADHTIQDLPVGGAYYVLDGQGTLLYYNIPFEATEEELQVYTRDLFDRVNRGELDGKDNEIMGMQGLTRGLYYQHTENGWLCILTVPYETLLAGVQSILVYYAIGLVLFLGVALGMWLRDRKLSRAAKRVNETVQVMGDIYYAFYRVNIVTGTFEMTKPSPHVREQMTGTTGDYGELLKVIAAALDEWTSEEFLQNFSLENIRLLVEQDVRDFGGEFLRKFGEEDHWISVRMLANPERIPNEVVICFRDVEDEKEEQQRQVQLLKGALSAAAQSERSQKQFFSVMSHDMRTPLNIIIGMANLALQEGCDKESMVGYLNKIGAASQQLLALINDILEISRLEQGNVSMEIKPFDLREIIETCLSPFQAQALDQGKDFQLSIDVKNRLIKGDPVRLGQIINNLVSNSMKFTKQGDRISVTLRQMDEGKRNNYLLMVSDTGTGMSKEFLPKLFDPYEREVRFGAKEVMGTGLGMPIVKNLINRMGGQIVVDSTLGVGTTFSVTIPFDASEALPPVQEQKPKDVVQLAGRRILLAEDNLLNMEIATELLKMRGADVTPAENGLEALEAFRNSELQYFDAILMDMQMPEMDGCQSAEAIRALDRPDAGTVPIIALTANAFAEDISRTAQAGMNAHLAKPINIELLCSTLTKLMSERSDAQD